MATFQITDVRVHPGDSAFLLDNGQVAILYDTGFGFTGYKVAEKIKSVLKDRSLDYIFLTHSHYDHALGSAYIKGIYPNAKVVAGAYAAKIFQKPSAKAVMWDLDTKFASANGVFDYENKTDSLTVDIPVSDGDALSVGNSTFVVLNLPGHTKCSVGYYCPEEKLLLGCETLGVFNGVDDVVPSYLVGIQMTLDSIARVHTLEVERILVPHFGVLEGTAAKSYLARGEERARQTAEDIQKQLQAGYSDEEILAWFKNEFYHGYIKTIYPVDAMELNTRIMINLVKKEGAGD